MERTSSKARSEDFTWLRKLGWRHVPMKSAIFVFAGICNTRLKDEDYYAVIYCNVVTVFAIDSCV